MTESDAAAAAALLDGEYEPSPRDTVREQVAGYEASGGAQDNTVDGRPVVILTTVGAGSGKVRKNPVLRMLEGDVYVAVASAGGAPKDPAWYRNLVAHPIVRLQDGAEPELRRAREVHGDEKTHWWQVAETFSPNFPAHRARAGRDIPVVVLERLEA